jgi:hypothetical protein
MKTIWNRIVYIIGVVMFIVGTIDPLEGSVLIGAGCALITLATFLRQEWQWRIFFTSLVLIVIGVYFLFYFSDMGGFGGTSKLSWWWGILVLPYPIGWLIAVVTLITRIPRKSNKKSLE